MTACRSSILATRGKEPAVTKLDEGTRRAWATYRDSLRDLDGDAYDEAERRSWERLQRDLERIEERHNDTAAPRRREGDRP